MSPNSIIEGKNYSLQDQEYSGNGSLSDPGVLCQKFEVLVEEFLIPPGLVISGGIHLTSTLTPKAISLSLRFMFLFTGA